MGEIDAESLSNMVENKDKQALANYGGASGLAKRLNTDLVLGLSKEEVQDKFSERIKRYGRNYIPDKEARSFFSFFFDALQDGTIIILMISALVSVVLSLTVEKES